MGRRLDHQGPVRASEQVETNEGLNLEWPSFVEEVCVCMYVHMYVIHTFICV